MYSLVVNHKGFKRNMRVVAVLEGGDVEKRRILMSTDTSLSGLEVYEMYKDRFQIEYLFRDGKQHVGLNEFEMRRRKGVYFHLNAVMTALNVLRIQSLEELGEETISVGTMKQRNLNELIMRRIFCKLAPHTTWQKFLAANTDTRHLGSLTLSNAA